MPFGLGVASSVSKPTLPCAKPQVPRLGPSPSAPHSARGRSSWLATVEPTSQVEMIWSPPHLLGVVGDFTCTSCWVAHQVFKWMRKSVQLSPFNTTQRNSKLRRQKVVCFQPHTTEARGHLQKEGPKSENRPPKEILLKSKGLVRSNSCGCWADS